MIVTLRQQLVEKQQRGMLRVTGTADEVAARSEKCIAELLSVWPELRILRFGYESEANSFSQQNDKRIKKYRSLLGQECDLLVFNVFAGLNPDALAALAGTVKVGGMCLMLTPTDEAWLDYSDPEKEKLCVAPFQSSQLSSWYEKRFVTLLSDTEACVQLQQGNYSSDFGSLKSTSSQFTSAPSQSEFKFNAKNKQQEAAITGIVETLEEKEQVALIVADRGRGKSSSLGLAVSEYFDSTDGKSNLALVSPYSDSVQTVMHHLKQGVLAKNLEFSEQTNQVTIGAKCLKFIAPDQIQSQIDDIDGFLVDEAAAIPVFLLEPILNARKPLILATTISGYEGTGRGFEYKLKPKLKSAYGGINQYELSQPIRFNQGDAFEPLINRLLALDIEIPPLSNRGETTSPYQVKKIEKERLSNEPELLNGIFALLVNAHYQTKPSDLRTLLDAPNMSVWVIKDQQTVIAAVLVAEEGPISAELVGPIWRGERRPRGHLFPQSMICHAGFESAADFRYARVVRIAVHPELQGRGIGSHFLSSLIDAYQSQDFDFVCTSFGASQSLIRFWQQSGLKPVRMGLKKEKASGEVSILMALGLTQETVKLQKQWSQRFEQVLECEFKLGLRNDFKSLRTPDIDALSCLDDQDKRDLDCFINFYRPLDTVWLPLWRLLTQTSEQKLPVLKIILDNADHLPDAVKLLCVSGEKALNQKLKQELKPVFRSLLN